MKIAVVSPKVPKDIKKLIDFESRVVYAVDSAVHELLKQGVLIDLAIGDFDSLKNKALLKDIKTIKLSKDKDDSDTAYALRHAYQKTDDVVLIGGLHSKRVDHLVANIMLLEKYPNLTIMDNNNLIKRYDAGEYTINSNDYKYLSIFPIDNTKITIKDTFYELNNYKLYRFDTLGLSNKIIKKQATLQVHEGSLLVIQSK